MVVIKLVRDSSSLRDKIISFLKNLKLKIPHMLRDFFYTIQRMEFYSGPIRIDLNNIQNPKIPNHISNIFSKPFTVFNFISSP